MKLLTPVQNNELKQVETGREILRVEEYRKATAKARKEFANAQADFNAMLARNRHAWAVEEDTHAHRIKMMQREVNELEDRKARALIPLSMYKEQADVFMAEARVFLESAKHRESEAEDLNDRLQDKLDELGEREQNVLFAEQQITNQTKGIAEQSEQIIRGNKTLTRAILDFGLVRTKAEQDIDERKTALALWDRTLVAKEEQQRNAAKSLQEWERRLKDERGTLDRAWKELDKRKGISP